MYLSFPFNPSVGAVLAVLSLPHLLYCFVWLRASVFISLSKKLNMPALDLFYKVSIHNLLSPKHNVCIVMPEYILTHLRAHAWQISVGLKFVQFTALGIWGFKVCARPVPYIYMCLISDLFLTSVFANNIGFCLPLRRIADFPRSQHVRSHPH